MQEVTDQQLETLQAWARAEGYQSIVALTAIGLFPDPGGAFEAAHPECVPTRTQARAYLGQWLEENRSDLAQLGLELTRELGPREVTAPCREPTEPITEPGKRSAQRWLPRWTELAPGVILGGEDAASSLAAAGGE